MKKAYAASQKLPDWGLVRQLAVEHGKSNIRANAIAPGLIKTYFSQALWDRPLRKSGVERSVAGAPLKRIGHVDEIAGGSGFPGQLPFGTSNDQVTRW